MTIEQTGLHLQPGQGRSYYFGADLYTFKAIGAETGEAYTLCEITVAPQGGSPPHRHSRESESFYVLSGEIDFRLDDQVITATPGTFLYSPPGQVHCFTNTTTDSATLLVWITPAGFEKFVAEVGKSTRTQLTPGTALDPETLEKILATAPKYGIEIIPPAA